MVTERCRGLWAIFNFLMPGYLGTRAAFEARYGAAVAAVEACNRRMSEVQAAGPILEGLRRKVSENNSLVFQQQNVCGQALIVLVLQVAMRMLYICMCLHIPLQYPSSMTCLCGRQGHTIL